MNVIAKDAIMEILEKTKTLKLNDLFNLQSEYADDKLEKIVIKLYYTGGACINHIEPKEIINREIEDMIIEIKSEMENMLYDVTKCMTSEFEKGFAICYFNCLKDEED